MVLLVLQSEFEEFAASMHDMLGMDVAYKLAKLPFFTNKIKLLITDA